MRKGWIAGILFASACWIALLVVPLLAPQPICRSIYAYLDISDGQKVNRADFIFVPSGSMYYRLPYAVDLLRKDQGDTLVLTVTEPSEWRRELKEDYDVDLAEASTVYQILRARGVVGDTEVIFLGQSRSSRQDAKLFVDFLAGHPASSALVISDGYHLRRLRLAFREAGEESRRLSNLRIAYVASSNFDDMLNRGTEPSDAYQNVFKEFIKYVFYVTGRA